MGSGSHVSVGSGSHVSVGSGSHVFVGCDRVAQVASHNHVFEATVLASSRVFVGNGVVARVGGRGVDVVRGGAPRRPQVLKPRHELGVERTRRHRRCQLVN